MSHDLTLPAIQGLLRRGSPVIVDGSGGSGGSGGSAIVVGVWQEHNVACVAAAHWREAIDLGATTVGFFGDRDIVPAMPSLRPMPREPLSRLHLDLTDATGRAHAAWWLALREVPTSHHLDPAAVSWARAPAQASAGWAMHWCARAVVGGGSLTGTWWTGSDGSPLPRALLADLNPNDDTRLPDGSRRVDAEALRRVVLHVAGVTP